MYPRQTARTRTHRRSLRAAPRCQRRAAPSREPRRAGGGPCGCGDLMGCGDPLGMRWWILRRSQGLHGLRRPHRGSGDVMRCGRQYCDRASMRASTRASTRASARDSHGAHERRAMAHAMPGARARRACLGARDAPRATQADGRAHADCVVLPPPQVCRARQRMPHTIPPRCALRSSLFVRPAPGEYP